MLSKPTTCHVPPKDAAVPSLLSVLSIWLFLHACVAELTTWGLGAWISIKKHAWNKCTPWFLPAKMAISGYPGYSWGATFGSARIHWWNILVKSLNGRLKKGTMTKIDSSLYLIKQRYGVVWHGGNQNWSSKQKNKLSSFPEQNPAELAEFSR